MSTSVTVTTYRGVRSRRISIIYTATTTLPFIWVVITYFISHSSAYSPDVNHQAIAGLWRLKQRTLLSYPLKEFTVYPKVQKQQHDNENNQEVLLMLKEDGSFQQYSNEESIPDKLRFFHQKNNMDNNKNAALDRYFEFGKLKGYWNLIGDKLILAADRPVDDDDDETSSSSTSKMINNEDVTDTILEGEVVATSEKGLTDNPVLSHNDKEDTEHNNNRPHEIDKSGGGGGGGGRDKNKINAKSSSSSSSSSVLDTHLSVPKGQVKIGRFTYPKHHPSFFDAPIFNPKAGGKFELKQVLGSLNTRQIKNEEEFEEKFTESDFYNKTFLLTSHPIPEYKPKGELRWSIKYNKFVEEPPPKSKKSRNEEEKLLDQPVHGIRAIEVKFFKNNTFATIGGMGGHTILRGRFSVIGNKKDHIWMQILRFGFGRSVSGSVFSEGRSLSKEDEKVYWGKIQYDDDNEDVKGDEKAAAIDDSLHSVSEQKAELDAKDVDRRLVVNSGSVLFGTGIEPLPVGLFVLTETNPTELYDDDDDGDDDDDDDDDADNGDLFDDQLFLDPDNIFQ